MDRPDVRVGSTPTSKPWRAEESGLAGLFTRDATYRASPWAPPVEGIEAISEFWEAEREGPDEGFTMVSEVVAVDAHTAVVAAQVEYGGRTRRAGETCGCSVSPWTDAAGPSGVAVRPGAGRRALRNRRPPQTRCSIRPVSTS
jgi:hypothetical protein